MKIVVASVLVFVVGFSIKKYVVSASTFDKANNIADVMKEYPVDLIEFKLVLKKYIDHVCEQNGEYLERLKSNSDSCINEHQQAKQECISRVFRLAPLKINTESEVKQYGQDYKNCALPYKDIVG